MGKNYVQKKVTMNTIRVAAISTELAEAVRKNTKDPQFGFPVYTAEAGEGRIALADTASIGSRSARSEPRFSRWIRSCGVEPAATRAGLHSCGWLCEIFWTMPEFRRKLDDESANVECLCIEDAGWLRGNMDFGQAQRRRSKRLFARLDVHYVHVRSTTAGRYTFRLERAVNGIERPATQDAARPRRR